ncbi:MAG: hypothetical protein D6814_03280, partial [Calditrichaeota bacterium]
LEPDAAEAHYYLGTVHYRMASLFLKMDLMGKADAGFEKAAQSLQTVLRLQPTNHAAREMLWDIQKKWEKISANMQD